jgi:hypothetical protein
MLVLRAKTGYDAVQIQTPEHLAAVLELGAHGSADAPETAKLGSRPSGGVVSKQKTDFSLDAGECTHNNRSVKQNAAAFRVKSNLGGVLTGRDSEDG